MYMYSTCICVSNVDAASMLGLCTVCNNIKHEDRIVQEGRKPLKLKRCKGRRVCPTIGGLLINTHLSAVSSGLVPLRHQTPPTCSACM